MFYGTTDDAAELRARSIAACDIIGSDDGFKYLG
jgi:hypothetical protein